MLQLMGIQILLKTGYEIVILPVTEVVVRKVKEHENIDVFDEGISYNPFKITDI